MISRELKQILAAIERESDTMKKKAIKAFIKVAALYPKTGNWWHVDNGVHFTVEETELMKSCGLFDLTYTGNGFKVQINPNVDFVKKMQRQIWMYEELQTSN